MDLLLTGDHGEKVEWHLGEVVVLPAEPAACSAGVDRWLQRTNAEFVLFWRGPGRPPEPDALAEIAGLPGDVWHAGLRIGTARQARGVEFVRPTWMFAIDPPQSIVGTSWRLSLAACLARTAVLRQLGGLDGGFETLEGAALDAGHRYLANGAVVRHVPQLLTSAAPISTIQLTVYDEFRFIRNQYGRRWVYWAALRAALTGWPLLQLMRALVRLSSSEPFPSSQPYRAAQQDPKSVDRTKWHDRISILIPTLERYDYLEAELKQLAQQTIRPLDVVIVDQTTPATEAPELLRRFESLPIHYIHQSTTGQCTAWNAALQAAQGDYFLFLGDDADRLTPDFLERFAECFERSGADMVASVVEEVGGEPPPPSLRFARVSDIFPIAMIKREVLGQVGLMDLAYDRAKRADGDLAMRCYLAGALMILDPNINPLHHRAPRGGLRTHGVRIVTRGTSRRSIVQRHLPSASEIYLALRYFGPQQLREALWIQTVSSWSGSGGLLQRMLKLAHGVVFLPDTLLRIRRERRAAEVMLSKFPVIPALADSEEQSLSASRQVGA